MKAIGILLLAISSSLALDNEDSSPDVSEIDFEDLSEETIKSCLEQLGTCFTRRMCYTRMKDLEISCCKSSFTNGKYNYSAEEECMENKMSIDIMDCVETTEDKCAIAIYLYFAKVEDKIDDAEERIRLAVGEPINENQCEIYSDETEVEGWKMCQTNTDKDLEWMCDIYNDIMKDSPLVKRTCLEDFGKCVVDSLTEEKVQDICVSCCEESVLNKDDFFKSNKKCTKEKFRPTFKNCIKEVPTECTREIIYRYVQDKDAIKEVNKRVEDLVGVPPTESSCESYYHNAVRIILGICRNNEDEKLNFYCDLTQNILQNSNELDKSKYKLFQGDKGINTFN